MKRYLALFIIIFCIGFIPFILHLTINYDIKIIGDEEIIINVNEEYIDKGAVVTNNGKKIDKYQIVNNVNYNKVGKYEVLYKIKNITKKRIVNVVDSTAPEIRLIKNPYYIRNSKENLLNYIEVKDNYDKDLINNTKIDSDIDINKNGIYKVKYTVSDSNNNESVLETNINVQEKNTSGIPVLMYHWFYDDTKGETYEKSNSHNYISKTEFEKQIKYLKENNYYFPTWKELIDYIDGKIDLPKKSVILTDDDCKGSFFNVALKVVQKYQVPITSFCITKKSNWQKYVGEPYLEFQSHTDSLHERICKGSWDGAVMCKPYDVINEDIKLSIEKVKSNYAFAYPFGHYNDKIIKALKSNGIKLAFTIKEGRVKKGANKYKLPRVRVSRYTSIETYKRLVK